MTREVRVRDADKAIFRPKKANIRTQVEDRSFGNVIKRHVVCYTLFGHHDFLDGNDYPILGDIGDEVDAEDRELSFAKRISINGGDYKYYIKLAQDGHLFNPVGSNESRHNKFLKHAGRQQFEYREVNKKVFDFYLDFLRTRNLAYFRNAERETF